MKAYVFIETGEVRVPERGERYITEHGDIFIKDNDLPRPQVVLTRHEIEIPDGATDIYVGIERKGLPAYQRDIFRTSIPRPKVRKWIYEFTLGGITWRTVSPLSEEEYNQQSMTGHKVDETMVEVDE